MYISRYTYFWCYQDFLVNSVFFFLFFHGPLNQLYQNITFHYHYGIRLFDISREQETNSNLSLSEQDAVFLRIKLQAYINFFI